mgnify:CR=1 FL=1
MIHLFIAFIYQPFLNILVFFYWLLGIVSNGKPDMGIAVILLTIVIRILLLPMSLAEDRSQEDRRAMAKMSTDLAAEHSADPVRQREEVKKLSRSNRLIVIGEIFSLVVQVMISLMLWKIFATGLSGADLHLIYPFMPHVDLPFNLVFLNKFDLTHSNVFLNIMQSVMIFLVETANILTSPYPPMKGEVVRLQLILPLVSFGIFMFLPAGKKLFIITTLIISFILIIYKFIRRKIQDHIAQKAEEEMLAAQQAAALLTPQPVPVAPVVAPVPPSPPSHLSGEKLTVQMR